MAPPDALHEALGAILRLLKRRRIPCMLMGGLALSVWGRIRVTQDIDLAVALDENREPRFLEDLLRLHFLPDKPRPVLGHRLLVCRYLKQSRGLPVEVDLFFARGAYPRQALRRAVLLRIGSQQVRVISPEDLILYKLLADRPMDRLDVRGIAEEQGGRLDRSYLKRWARRLGISKRLQGVL